MSKTLWAYFAGVASAIAIGGFIYLCSQSGKVRATNEIGNIEIQNAKIQIIHEDTKFSKDRYRIEITDGKGNMRANFIYQEVLRGSLTSPEGLVQKIDF